MAGPGKGNKQKGKGAAKAKANGASAGEATKSDRRVAKADNVRVSKRAMEGYANRYNELLDEKEKMAGETMSDVKNLLEKAANDTGLPRSVLRKALHEDRRQRKDDAAEKEMEPLERQQLNQCRQALGLFADSPLGAHALGALASAGKGKDAPDPDGDEDLQPD